MQAIEVTKEDRAAQIARQIINIISNAEAQVLRLRAGAPAAAARTLPGPNNSKVEVPEQPAVTKEDIDAKLGPLNVKTLDALAAALVPPAA